jgi:mono/diheme cytochrome c family protein
MAEVVYRSTQYLSHDDLNAMAVYLRQLPQAPPEDAEAPWWSWITSKRAPPRSEEMLKRGATVYKDNCAECHGDNGEGAVNAYPPLAGNRAVTMSVAANAIRAVLSGGFLPATAGNPRPYGMPPFAHVLSDEDIAAVLSYVRASWGNAGSGVSALEAQKYRAAPAK